VSADDRIDRAYLVETLSRLAQAPTDVPLGYETLMEPDDPKLVHYVQRVMRPELVQLDCYDLIDAPGNNLAVRLGSGETDRSLLIQNYTVAQHHNLMTEPFSGKIANARAYGHDEPAVFGQGVSQTKAHQAVMLAVIKALQARSAPLRGRLYWTINNEGRSSHACSQAIIATLGHTPDFGIIQIGTGLQLSLGNRGRIDVIIHVKGKATHSSVPDQGLSAIAGAQIVLDRLQRLSWPDQHPLLGGRRAVPYKIRYEPVAPHTLPSDAFITIDRRLLPEDDPDEAVREIREAVGDVAPYQVDVQPDVMMLPALVDPEHPGVEALRRAHRAVRGEPLETIYLQGSFDAGWACSVGIPTVMYGAGEGRSLLGDDFVTIAAVETEARVLTELILEQLG
jgi:acetylornithine deacetylase/succinyl-diaminopimelate desuccinylase-like protein